VPRQCQIRASYVPRCLAPRRRTVAANTARYPGAGDRLACGLDERIDGLSAEIEAVAAAPAVTADELPGLDPIIASATVAAIGTGEVKGAYYLGRA
jgi:hypothetical protein